MTQTIARDTLRQWLQEWLRPDAFGDAAFNGLQIEGKDQVTKVVCGVSANRALIQAAIDDQADALVVHHGLVWGGGIKSVTGWLKERVRLLLAHDISLFAYHLPLDAHPTLGNNAGLCDALALADGMPFYEVKGQPIGIAGRFSTPLSLAALTQRVQDAIGPPKAVFGEADAMIGGLGICSGGAPDVLHAAIETPGIDAVLTGEATEWVKALAEESGVAFIAAGHHATERFGPRRLAKALLERGVDAQFIDVENPV